MVDRRRRTIWKEYVCFLKYSVQRFAENNIKDNWLAWVSILKVSSKRCRISVDVETGIIQIETPLRCLPRVNFLPLVYSHRYKRFARENSSMIIRFAVIRKQFVSIRHPTIHLSGPNIEIKNIYAIHQFGPRSARIIADDYPS